MIETFLTWSALAYISGALLVFALVVWQLGVARAKAYARQTSRARALLRRVREDAEKYGAALNNGTRRTKR